MKPIDRIRAYHPELTAQRRPAGLLGGRLRLVVVVLKSAVSRYDHPVAPHHRSLSCVITQPRPKGDKVIARGASAGPPSRAHGDTS